MGQAMRDTSLFARPDSFPAASPVSAQPRQREAHKPGSLAHNLVRQNRGWTWAA
jgi:hypothetical protein